ncbi:MULTISPECIES: ABC transporter ATP-binding protein [unclassified Pseudoalteromonas]|uniref:ABC transporter ATP-binding protein n=1 Tax=unclassified Pseudoalteromonas TaxID=194690 RepID=UPI0025B4404E|nr:MULTISPECIES: ABC transporter ATP-binding protein [unclassified Pseudoalteromonas]MDN3379507.1 ABC transporter ATP-binding protein [Pseudoalteromonas sp. APC 3893]MDN3387847.1 ABC transporter ATP-binding protein [Pseudoalteromonas sp. APC 4017]
MGVESSEGEDSYRPWSIIFSICSPYKGKMLIALSLMAIVTFAELVPLYLLFVAIQTLLNPLSSSVGLLLWIAAGMCAAILLKTGLSIGAYYFSHQVAFKALTEVRMKLVTQLAYLPLTWLNKQNPGVLKQNILQDVEHIENFIAHQSVELFNAMLTPIIVFTLIAFIDWRLALSAVALVPLAFLTSGLFMYKTASQYQHFSQVSEDLTSTLNDYVKNMPVMKLYNLDSKHFNVLNRKLDRYHKLVLSLTSQTVPGWTLYTALLGASFVFLLPTAIALHSTQTVNIEQIILSVLLALGMLSSIIKVSRFFMEANELLAGVRRIAPLYLAHPAKLKHGPIDKKRMLMQFENVNFSYQSQQVINGVNLKLVPNSLNVVVGASGHGKSTVAMLACGLLSPSAGKVLLYAKEVSLLPDSTRAQLISVVTQECYLFEGTLRDNILFGRTGVSAEDLERAVVAAQLETWLAQLPNGLQTQIQVRGQNVSGGEKQRIAIARALVSNTPLVMLDEATAAMDNVTQANFYHALQLHYPNTTFLVITHKYLALENTSQIFVLNEGRIASQGSHDTLLASCEYYRHSWQLQQSEADQQSTLKDPLDL